jgi:hypothetical protein
MGLLKGLKLVVIHQSNMAVKIGRSVNGYESISSSAGPINAINL